MFLLSILGVIIVIIILADAFETIVLPKRVKRKTRLARLFYRAFWAIWTTGAKVLRNEKYREAYLGYFGPLSLLLLIFIWAAGAAIGYALINIGLDVKITSVHGQGDILGHLIASAATIIPFDMHAVEPEDTIGRMTFVAEAATGAGLIAVVIGYLPMLYEAFSDREIHINLMDTRAGSPPSALKLLKQYKGENLKESLLPLIAEWEVWCAELLESHMSYPILAYYRSQHDDQSWLTSLLLMLDVTALIKAGIVGIPSEKAKFTFDMAQHAAEDLNKTFNLTPQKPPSDRLSYDDYEKLQEVLKKNGIKLLASKKSYEDLKKLRDSYEPFIYAMSDFFLMPTSPFLTETK